MFRHISEFAIFTITVAFFLACGSAEGQTSRAKSPGSQSKGTDDHPTRTSIAPLPTPGTDQGEKPTPSSADLKALVEGNSAFALGLFSKLAVKDDENVVLAPYSISSALAMTYGGARGETAKEMAKVLHFALPPDRLHAAFEAVARLLQRDQTDQCRFQIANMLWGQKGRSFDPEYVALSKRHYAGGLHEVDFASDPEASRHRINSAMAEKTYNKITDLLKPGDVGPKTQLVLTNAIYFKGAWATPFLKEETATGLFDIGRPQRVPVPMMRTPEAHFRYLMAVDCEWLELPYVGRQVSMVLLLPKKGQFSAVEQRLTPAVIRSAVEKLEMRYGRVILPKFQVRSAVNLEGALSSMGMRLALSEAADFSGIAPGGGLRIGRVAHHAYLGVDEAGSEAAAATAVTMLSGLPPRFSFTADRPFHFFIRDNQCGSILFAGRVVRPGNLP